MILCLRNHSEQYFGNFWINISACAHPWTPWNECALFDRREDTFSETLASNSVPPPLFRSRRRNQEPTRSFPGEDCRRHLDVEFQINGSFFFPFDFPRFSRTVHSFTVSTFPRVRYLCHPTVEPSLRRRRFAWMCMRKLNFPSQHYSAKWCESR